MFNDSAVITHARMLIKLAAAFVAAALKRTLSEGVEG